MLEQKPPHIETRRKEQVPTAEIFARMSSEEQVKVLDLQKRKIQNLLERRVEAVSEIKLVSSMFNPVKVVSEMVDLFGEMDRLYGGVAGKVMGAFMATLTPTILAPTAALVAGPSSLYQGAATQISLVREKLRLRKLEDKFGGSR
jgi:hypothetical protein